MKKLFLLTMLILGISLANAQDGQYFGPNVEPMFQGSGEYPAGTLCNIFPICYSNNLQCDVQVCHTITFILNGSIATYQLCKTIPAGTNVCFTLSDFQNQFPGVNFPSQYYKGSDWLAGYGFYNSSELTISGNSASIACNSGIVSSDNTDQTFELSEKCAGQTKATMVKRNNTPCPASYTIYEQP